MDSGLGGFGYTQHRHKRSRADMEHDGSISPASSTWSAFRRLSESRNAHPNHHHHHNHNPSPHPQHSGLHLPPPHRSPIRFPGDGLDFRRPIMSSRNSGSQTPIIDLTADDVAPSSSSSSTNHNTRISNPNYHNTRSQGPNSSQQNTTRPQRPPRFSREIIDVDGSPPYPNTTPDSPEVEFISSRTIAPSRGNNGQNQPTHRAPAPPQLLNFTDLDTDDFPEIIRVNELHRRPPSRMRELHASVAANRMARSLDLFERVILNRAGARAGNGNGGTRSRGEPRIAVGFRPPVNMDFELVAFELGRGGGGGGRTTPPAPPTYEAPPKAPEGFTRSPRDDEVVVCPNCGDELCTGDSEVKRQVWILRGCGHVYCGECATNRFSSKKKGKEKLGATKSKPFKVCVVEGCDKKTSARTAMIQLFL